MADLTSDLKTWQDWLPSWEDCDRKSKASVPLTALERFILDNEPAGKEDENLFRSQLAAVVSDAYMRGALA